jgi:hypothetical protein
VGKELEKRRYRQLLLRQPHRLLWEQRLREPSEAYKQTRHVQAVLCGIFTRCYVSSIPRLPHLPDLSCENASAAAVAVPPLHSSCLTAAPLVESKCTEMWLDFRNICKCNHCSNCTNCSSIRLVKQQHNSCMTSLVIWQSCGKTCSKLPTVVGFFWIVQCSRTRGFLKCEVVNRCRGYVPVLSDRSGWIVR